jgi:hypothetical protein
VNHDAAKNLEFRLAWGLATILDPNTHFASRGDRQVDRIALQAVDRQLQCDRATIRLLLAAGAKIDVRNQSNMNALEGSVFSGNSGVEELIAAGARLGIIRFGSRVDVDLPPGAKVAVALRDRVVSGESALARTAAASL